MKYFLIFSLLIIASCVSPGGTKVGPIQPVDNNKKAARPLYIPSTPSAHSVTMPPPPALVTTGAGG